MEELNNKKVILVIIIALLVIAAIILGVIFLGKDGNEEESKAGSISMTESEFEPLKIKNVELTYKEDTTETILEFGIENATDEKVEKQTIIIQLLGESEQPIASIETYVETIDPKGTHKVNMVLAGNIQGIKKIKLVKPEQQEEQPAE